MDRWDADGNREVRLQKMVSQGAPSRAQRSGLHALTATAQGQSLLGELKHAAGAESSKMEGLLSSCTHSLQGVPVDPRERPQLASSDVGRQDTLSGRSGVPRPLATALGRALLSAQPATPHAQRLLANATSHWAALVQHPPSLLCVCRPGQDGRPGRDHAKSGRQLGVTMGSPLGQTTGLQVEAVHAGSCARA